MAEIDIDLLTPRELECGKWLVLGKTAEETAAILGLSRRTIEDYLASMKVKLRCSNKVQLAIKLFTHNPKDNIRCKFCNKHLNS